MSAAPNTNDWNLRWLQRMRAINGGPLPVVNDQMPWQASAQALQTPVPSWGGQAMQDTGGGESAPGPWSDNTPVQGGARTFDAPPEYAPTGRIGGGNAFGTTYKDPGGGWNPWSLYDGRQGSDGSAVDGWYNAAADSAKWQLNGQPENDRNRVWRWTLDALGPNPGGQPPERVKQVFLEQVARLKRDYANTPGMNWAGSAFSGYDKMPGAQGGQGGAPATSGPAPGRGTPTPGQPAPGGAGVSGGGQSNQGGSNVANPFPVSSPNPIIGPNAGNTGGGGGGAFGGAGAVNAAYPQQVAYQYMKSHNMNPDGHGFFGDFIRKLMGSLMPEIMSLTLDENGQPSMDKLANIGAIMDPIFYGGAGTLGKNLANFAGTAQSGLASSLGGMDVPTQASLLQHLSALRNFGSNQYAQQATANRLDTGINRAKDYAFGLAQQGQDTPDEWNLMDFINSLQGRR